MTQEQKIFPYIERLLQGTEVVWTTLGDEKKIEIANANRRPVKASERISGNIPYYGANNIQDYVEGYTHEGTYILIAEDGTKSIENYSVQWATGKFWANNHVHVLRGKNNVDSRFIYYYLQTVNFVPFLTGGDRAKLTKAKLLEIEIPLPPLSVQQEIVRILDKFTQLEAELEAELDCRKRQYEYYRNKLLTFNEIEGGTEIVWKTLGEVGEVTKLAGFEFTNYVKYNDTGKIIALRGLNVKGSLDLSDVKYIDESDFSKLNRSKLYINDMLFTYVGTVGSVALIPENDKYYLAPNVARIRFLDRKINPRFMFHYFQSDEFKKKQINRYLGSSSMKNLTMENIRKFQIPLPPLEEQQRIATILDKFNTLVNSISEGLPKEIALLRKQYEYYREKLLSFPK